LSQIDPSGLDTYRVNRDLQAVQLLGLDVSASSSLNPLTHTFIVTTNPDGTVGSTYSWGNDANSHGWNRNQPLDVKTAAEALQSGLAERIGGRDLDPYVEGAFATMNRSQYNHVNGFVSNNCKAEADRLIERAKALQQYSFGRTDD
jgi:hypothetical protein